MNSIFKNHSLEDEIRFVVEEYLSDKDAPDDAYVYVNTETEFVFISEFKYDYPSIKLQQLIYNDNINMDALTRFVNSCIH
jgi:hypothetical protein